MFWRPYQVHTVQGFAPVRLDLCALWLIEFSDLSFRHGLEHSLLAQFWALLSMCYLHFISVRAFIGQ